MYHFHTDNNVFERRLLTLLLDDTLAPERSSLAYYIAAGQRPLSGGAGWGLGDDCTHTDGLLRAGVRGLHLTAAAAEKAAAGLEVGSWAVVAVRVSLDDFALTAGRREVVIPRAGCICGECLLSDAESDPLEEAAVWSAWPDEELAAQLLHAQICGSETWAWRHWIAPGTTIDPARAARLERRERRWRRAALLLQARLERRRARR